MRPSADGYRGRGAHGQAKEDSDDQQLSEKRLAQSEAYALLQLYHQPSNPNASGLKNSKPTIKIVPVV